MRFKPFKEKNKKKNWNLFDFRSDPDPDPHQNEANPKHWYKMNKRNLKLDICYGCYLKNSLPYLFCSFILKDVEKSLTKTLTQTITQTIKKVIILKLFKT